MRPLVVALALLLTAVASPAQAVDIEASKVEVSFHISHPAKKYDANLLANGAQATASFDPSDMSSLRARASIRVKMFDSDNTRRDSHMLETLEGLIFPTIDWSVESVSGLSGPIRAGTFDIRARGPMTLHGVTKDLEIPVKLVVTDAGHLTAESAFTISLEAWGIDRPTLLFVPIADDVPIRVRMAFPGAGKFEWPKPAAATPAPAPPVVAPPPPEVSE